jgi:acyl-CoA thioester hydrolase
VLSPRFRFRHLETVRFRDLDAIGHVNNAVFLTYFESARLAYWFHTTRREGLSALDIVLARAEVDYRSPLQFGESIEISVGCTSIGRSSFVLESDMHERGSGRLVAESRKVLVCYDYAAGRSRPVADELRRLILAQDPEAGSASST